MIVVSNTKELEEYGLKNIRDDEMVQVWGGLTGKTKYQENRYQLRVTYTGRQIKQMITQMQMIENAIPPEWNQFQRAKYIYETLGNSIRYHYNSADYGTQQYSNLSPLMSGEAICAGYSLVYKEMMDRQGIPCDYVRGRGYVVGNHSERHAWNVLTIGGVSFPVDLTWDSGRLRRGETGLSFFGNNPSFEQEHKPDSDERLYRSTLLTNEFVDSIDCRIPAEREENKSISPEQKNELVKSAIRETYLKLKKEYGIDDAKASIPNAFKMYVLERKTNGFTRDNGARENLEKHVTVDDMIEVLAQSFIENGVINHEDDSILAQSLRETYEKYGEEHTLEALGDFVKYGSVEKITRTNDARAQVQKNVTMEEALELLCNQMAEHEIELIEKSEIQQQKIIQEATENYFSGDEFAKVKTSPDKENEVMKWIRQQRSYLQKPNKEKEETNKGGEEWEK